MPTVVNAELSPNSGSNTMSPVQAENEFKPYILFGIGVNNSLKVVDSNKFSIKKSPNLFGALGFSNKIIEGELSLIHTNNHAKYTWYKAAIKDIQYINTQTQSFITSYAMMGNINYIFKLHETLNPYIGIGSGIAKVKLKRTDSYTFKGDESREDENKKGYLETFVYQRKNMPAYQVILGGKYTCSDVVINLNYRYFSTFNEVKLRGLKGKSHRFQYHSFNVGVQFLF
jgi:opacity protein-like surface antigen